MPMPQYKGLCSKCYQVAKTLIHEGKTTWQELAKMGLATVAGFDTQEDAFIRAFKQRSKHGPSE